MVPMPKGYTRHPRSCNDLTLDARLHRRHSADPKSQSMCMEGTCQRRHCERSVCCRCLRAGMHACMCRLHDSPAGRQAAGRTEGWLPRQTPGSICSAELLVASLPSPAEPPSRPADMSTGRLPQKISAGCIRIQPPQTSSSADDVGHVHLLPPHHPPQ